MSDFWIRANWDVPTHIRAGTTTRQFGNSLAPYEQGNLALHVQDDENTVLQNRNFIRQKLNLPNEPFWLNQTHSSNIIHLNENTRNHHADASYTNTSKHVLCVLTADCLPILLCSKTGDEIAAVHAGWRGLANGIIENAVTAFNTASEAIIAWIGPAISQPHYEIGREVHDQILKTIPQGKTCFLESKPNHFYMNLSKLAELHLRTLGVNNVKQSKLCSYTDPKRFYSYRRDGITGRYGDANMDSRILNTVYYFSYTPFCR